MAHQQLHELQLGPAWVPGAEPDQGQLAHRFAELEGAAQALHRTDPAEGGELDMEGVRGGVSHH